MENNQITAFLSRDTTLSLIEAKKQINDEINNYLNDNKFNYIVTADNIAEVKKNNAELNKTAKALKDFAAKIINKEMESVNQFKIDLKEYLEKIEKKRVERLEAIKLFEDKTKEVLKDLLEDYAEKLKANFNIRKEFDNVSIDDLIKLGNITGGGALSKSGKDGVGAKIQQCLALQNRYDLRVSNLKVVCYEKGLETPLTENYVQGIIFIDDEADYQDKLNRMIADEVQRLAKIKEEIEAKAIKEAENKILQEKAQFQKEFRVLIDNANTVEALNNLLATLNEKHSKFMGQELGDEITEKINFLADAKQVKQEDSTSNIAVGNPTSKKVEEDTTLKEQEVRLDDKKIVNIQVDLQFLVKNSVADTKILDKINEMLKNAGFSESIKSVKIVQGN